MIYLTSLVIAMITTIDPISFDFKQLKTNQIMIVNDSVMGGKSESKFEIKEKTIKFSGDVSMKNNGGFASLRMLWPFQETAGFDKIKLILKGDGKSYQFRLRTSRGFDGAAYVYEFDTTKDESLIVEMNLDEFVPSFRGRVLKDMPQLELQDVQQMGFLIADKQVGNFTIDIESIVISTQ